MTYEYLCTACDNVWEAEQSISEAALKVCPRCKKETAKRQVSGGAGFILKGGGWYADLYGSAPKKSADASTESSSGDSKKPSEPKKSDATTSDTSTSSTASTPSKESSKGSGGSDGGSKGSPSGSGSGSKGGAAPSAA